MSESPAAPLLRHLLTPLEAWLSDPATEEICINRPGEGWVRRRGRFARYDLPFDLTDLESIAILAGALRRQDVDETTPLLATELPDGERLQVCVPPAVPHGTVSLTIRKLGRDVAPLSAAGGRYRAARWNAWRKLQASRDMTELLALYGRRRLVRGRCRSPRRNRGRSADGSVTCLWSPSSASCC